MKRVQPHATEKLRALGLPTDLASHAPRRTEHEILYKLGPSQEALYKRGFCQAVIVAEQPYAGRSENLRKSCSLALLHHHGSLLLSLLHLRLLKHRKLSITRRKMQHLEGRWRPHRRWASRALGAGLLPLHHEPRAGRSDDFRCLAGDIASGFKRFKVSRRLSE